MEHGSYTECEAVVSECPKQRLQTIPQEGFCLSTVWDRVGTEVKSTIPNNYR